jgi:hypothetical protein
LCRTVISVGLPDRTFFSLKLGQFIFDGALEMPARYLGNSCNRDPSPRKQY